MMMLQDVINTIQSTERGSTVPQATVRHWMASEDLEVLGAVFSLLHKPKCYDHISPQLCFEDYHIFHMKFYERCLRDNPMGEWSETRYSAAISLVSWFVGLWNDISVPRTALADLKKMLERLYISDNEELRCCIITGALEHLFEDKNIREYFSDWLNVELLGSAYQEACEYSDQILERRRTKNEK